MINVGLYHVYKNYPGASKKWALKDFNLEVFQGEFFCLVGPSGCGKSTVLKIISDLEKPTSGVVNKPENISLVFQLGALLPWLSVEENIGFGLKMRNTPKKQMEQSVQGYMEMVGLSDFAKKYPRELSGGQRQRVGIARALTMEPDVLLLDEPFSALDPLTTEGLHEDLLSIWKQTSKTIIMVSHFIEEAVRLADRVGVMSDGSMKEIFDVRLSRPRNIHEDGFLGLTERISKSLGLVNE